VIIDSKSLISFEDIDTDLPAGRQARTGEKLGRVRLITTI